MAGFSFRLVSPRFVSSSTHDHFIDDPGSIWYSFATMSQDRIIRLISEGDAQGVGKGHVYYTTKNRRTHADTKFVFKKYNPISKSHTTYTEKK